MVISRLLCIALLLGAFWPQHAEAQLRRCSGGGGQVIYTDRNCNDIGATELALHAPASAQVAAPYRGGCARRLDDLVYGLGSAIDAKDVNRMAMLYDWAGMSTRQGYAIMARLDGIVKRPLIDVAPVYARPPPILAADGTVLDANLDGYYPQTDVRMPLIGVRLEQTFSDGVTPSRTVFGLRKRLGCWWISL